MSINDLKITGNHEIEEAANLVVDCAVYYATDGVPTDERLLEIRALVHEEVTGLVVAVRRHIQAMANPNARPTISPADLARHWGIKIDKVLNWISSGQLKAVNVAANASGKPRYRIDAEALAAFKAARTLATPEPRRRRRSRPEDDVPQYV